MSAARSLANHGADVEWIRSQAAPCLSDHFMVLSDLVNCGVGTQADFDALDVEARVALRGRRC